MASIASVTALPTSLIAFIREARSELRKVSWPHRETTIRYTLIVIVSSLAVGLITGGIDYLLTLGLEQLI